MHINAIIGIAASLLTATSMIPQLVKIVREKEAGDISVTMLLVLLAGLGLWTAYGFLLNDWIITAANGFSFLVNAAILVFTMKYR
jgi:MtN3 and saliva related transmembrane protein